MNGGLAHPFAARTFARLPLDKNEGAVKDKRMPRSAGHRFFAREVEDQDSGNEISRQSPAVGIFAQGF